MLSGDQLIATAHENPRLTALAAFFAGALLMLSFAPAGLFLLAPLLLVPLFVLWTRLPPGPAARIGFWFGAGLFLAGTHWLYVSIHVFGQAPLAIAVFLMLGLVVIMGCYYALVGWTVARISSAGRRVLLAGIPAAWVVVEWIRGWFLSGFPWMSLGYGQIDSPLAGLAPVTGVYGISFALVFSATCLSLALAAPLKERVALLVLAIVPWFAGVSLQSVGWTSESGPAVRTTVVQGGISQDRKWLREQFGPTLDLYRQSLADNPDSELIVWPEVAIPAALDQVTAFVDYLQGEVSRRGQTLLFGILERPAETGRVYNSVVALTGTDQQIYRKRHLVPFGEFFPVPAFVREWMRLMSLPHSDISAGDAEQELLRMPDGNQLSVAICYEDAYGAEQLYALPDASILINVSNDAWFGNTIAPHQHLEIARMRALEAGRYVVRATNNGVSAFIGPSGELLETGPQFEFVSMTVDVTPQSGATPYANYGNWPIVSLCLALLAGCLLASRKGR